MTAPLRIVYKTELKLLLVFASTDILALGTQQHHDHITLTSLPAPLIHGTAYLTGDTSRLRYRAQPVNAVWGNSRCLQ
jgi:hypothetical protein